MAERGGQEGNLNSIKGRRWNAAIDRALAKKSKASGIEELDRLAEQFLKEVEASGIIGFKELADRLDGKAQQSVELSGEVGSYVARTPEISKNADTWAETHAPFKEK